MIEVGVCCVGYFYCVGNWFLRWRSCIYCKYFCRESNGLNWKKEDYIIYIEYKYCFVKYFEFFDKCIKLIICFFK